jgi:hypothetical protein
VLSFSSQKRLERGAVVQHVRADAGGELGVIYDSAVALLQGLFPATTNYTTDLANGTVVTGALGGYQVCTLFPTLFRRVYLAFVYSTFQVSDSPSSVVCQVIFRRSRVC